MALSFDVCENLNEFFVSDSDSAQISIKEPHNKREEKRLRKEAKKQRARRLSNSNLVIPTTDEDVSDDSQSSDDSVEVFCPICAGRHEAEDCRNRSNGGNQKYMHYENVRNKFAKDVGFNYRRDQNRDQSRRYVETLEVEDDGWGRQI